MKPFPLQGSSVTARRLAQAVILIIALGTALSTSADDIVFAVVTKVVKEKHQAIAQAVMGGTVTEITLIPTDAVVENLIWRGLEVCHSLRLEGTKTADGYQIRSIKTLDAAMLPMALQGIAGDCLLRKALEFAPLVD